MKEPKEVLALFGAEIQVVNMGLPTFAEDLKRQKVPVLHADWRPPAGGNEKVLGLLERIRKNAVV